MKNLDKKHTYLLLAGLLVMSLSFILGHFITISDFLDGIFKGTGIGLMIYSLISQMKSKRKKTSSIGQ